MRHVRDLAVDEDGQAVVVLPVGSDDTGEGVEVTPAFTVEQTLHEVLATEGDGHASGQLHAPGAAGAVPHSELPGTEAGVDAQVGVTVSVVLGVVEVFGSDVVAFPRLLDGLVYPTSRSGRDATASEP